MQETAGTGLWCRWCGLPARAEGGATGLVRRLESAAVHDGTGLEECADGEHLAAPADFRPACGHEADPDTAYTTTGLRADLGRELDYPADAQCLHCRQWIRRDTLAAPWRLKYPDEVPS